MDSVRDKVKILEEVEMKELRISGDDFKHKDSSSGSGSFTKVG